MKEGVGEEKKMGTIVGSPEVKLQPVSTRSSE